MKSKYNLIIFYLVAAGDGISGGTRIHIECTKKWQDNNIFESITVLASDDGYSTCLKYGVYGSNLQLISTIFTKKINFWIDYITRIFVGIYVSISYKLDTSQSYILYAASDFWADFFPALIIHLRYLDNTRLISPIYLFAPKIFHGYDGRLKFSLKLIVYNLMQKVMCFFAKRYSNAIFVTYTPDIERLWIRGFDSSRQPQYVIVGGIEMGPTVSYSAHSVDSSKYEYDAVFVGRYHPQKGIYQLMDIWKIVCETKKDAKLAVLGNGDKKFDTYINDFITKNNLSKNIFLLGFMDGKSKYELFSKTKIYLNTNLYDAGGMATMEAMSCGLPVISFDFPNSKSMIEKGSLWADYLDVNDFANKALELLNNADRRLLLGLEARKFIGKYDWSLTASRISKYFKYAFDF